MLSNCVDADVCIKTITNRGAFQVFLHIVGMLLVTSVLFVLSSTVGPDGLGIDGCRAVAALLQLSLMCAFAWMCADG